MQNCYNGYMENNNNNPEFRSSNNTLIRSSALRAAGRRQRAVEGEEAVAGLQAQGTLVDVVAPEQRVSICKSISFVELKGKYQNKKLIKISFFYICFYSQSIFFSLRNGQEVYVSLGILQFLPLFYDLYRYEHVPVRIHHGCMPGVPADTRHSPGVLDLLYGQSCHVMLFIFI